MTERRLVKAGGAEFYVEVSDTAGPTTIRDAGPLSFDGVQATTWPARPGAPVTPTLSTAKPFRWPRN